MKKVKCSVCYKLFYRHISKIIRSKNIYCSHKCWGKKVSEFHKIGVYTVPKNFKNTGRTRFKEGQNVNEKHPMWKGDKVNYFGIHAYLRKHYLPPTCCQECGIETKWIDLANITGIHKRDISNYKYVCRSCHRKLDKSSYLWMINTQLEPAIKGILE